MGPVGSEVLVLKGGVLPPGNIVMVPMNWKLELLLSTYWALSATEPTGREYHCCVEIDPSYQREFGWFFCGGGKKDYFWEPRGSLEFLLRLWLIKKMWQPSKDKTTDSFPTGMNFVE